MRRWLALMAGAAVCAVGGCRGSSEEKGEPGPATHPKPQVIPLMTAPTRPPGTEVARAGDEIMVAGRLFHTSTRVVLYSDPGGYDAYRTERRFSPWGEAAFLPATRGQASPEGQPGKPNRYGARDAVLSWGELEQVRGGGWPLEVLQQKVDQFVIHFDAVGTSRACFHTLQDDRGLSVHFMLDIDGTIYQTLDVKERAFHATTANFRSVGIEVANRGAYESEVPLREFYARDEQGPRIALPARFGDGGVLVPGVYRPMREGLVRGTVNGLKLVMYDYTPQQYAALAKLTATLCTVLPKITLRWPADARGGEITGKLPEARLAAYQGLLGHYHVQENKDDPGPAFQWELVIENARAMMSPEALAANKAWSHDPVRPSALATMPVRR